MLCRSISRDDCPSTRFFRDEHNDYGLRTKHRTDRYYDPHEHERLVRRIFTCDNCGRPLVNEWERRGKVQGPRKRIQDRRIYTRERRGYMQASQSTISEREVCGSCKANPGWYTAERVSFFTTGTRHPFVIHFNSPI